MTSTSIQHAIAQAQAAADAVTPGQGQIVPFGRPISLTDNLVGGFSVDTWLKVKPYGMTIGKDTTTLFDRLVLRIDLSTVVYCRRVRYGNPAEYRTTYDGVHDFRGGLWAHTVARARSNDPKCQGDYRSADIPLIAAVDIVAKDGTILADQGSKICYAPAITGWHCWADLILRLVAAGFDPEHDLIEVTARVQYNKEPQRRVGHRRLRGLRGDHMIITHHGRTVEFLGDPHLGKPLIHGVSLHRRGDREKIVWADFERSVSETFADFHINLGDLLDRPVAPYDVIVRAARICAQAAQHRPYTHPDPARQP